MFNDKTALVTGASRGIGQAIAIELGIRGATVVGTATTEDGARAIDAMLREQNLRGTGLIADVTDGDSVGELVTRAQDAFGSPLVLVNNAGVTRDNLLMRMKDNEWHEVIETDLNSVYRLSKACIRAMTKARYGRIINIASAVALTGNAGQANYAAAKAGMIGFAKSLAQEVGARGVTVNTVAPGFIDTDMTRVLDDGLRDAVLSRIPVNRFGRTEEVAKTVAFLASEDAAYITGETLHVNGGLYMA